jgi:hypothetical protein
MGNALGCAGLGERLAAAARDGDAAEARRLLAADPGLARCTATFGNLSSPLHLAASKGHHEVRTWLRLQYTLANTCMLMGDNAVQDDYVDCIHNLLHGGWPARTSLIRRESRFIRASMTSG